MNCIFICVFNQEKYVDMFYLLLESILLYGNLGPNTEILVYTSTKFMNMIKQSQLYKISFNTDELKFEICDTYDNIDKACKARLDLFNLPSNIHYSKILYLDTDILIKGDINKVFNVCEDDILYVLDEGGFINDNHDYYGKTLFGNEINNYSDKSSFTTGILLFNNCHKIKELFIEINKDIINRPYNFSCFDQPYIVYNAFKYNLYNNKILKHLVVNNDFNIYSDKVIHHFPGGPGIYRHKIDAMTIFLKKLKKRYYFKIPKILFQTNKISNKKYVLDMINNMLSPDWKYEFYDDDQVIQFFIDNPIEDLPNIIKKYNSFKSGAHRADLFRYYYLYINGGFFMDSDAMLYTNIDTITKNYDFVSVNSSYYPGTIFQGIIGASPKNEIIKLALYDAYNTNQSILEKNYHYFCKQLYDIIKNNHFGYNIKLYREKYGNRNYVNTLDDKNNILFKHYWRHKIIPPINKIIPPINKIIPPINKIIPPINNNLILTSIVIILLVVLLSIILMIIIHDKLPNNKSSNNKLSTIIKKDGHLNKTKYTDEFTKIYKTNYWIKGSGAGSYIKNTIEYNKCIIDFIKNNNITSITDIGCGDWQSTYLIYQEFDNIDYVGLDCVDFIIEKNKKNHPKYKFYTLDLLCNVDLIRDCDLYIIKDVLQHWKLKDIYDFLDKLILKNFKYIIITNNNNQKCDNLELNAYIGNGRGLNSNFLPLKKYNAELLLEYIGDEAKHMCIIKKIHV